MNNKQMEEIISEYNFFLFFIIVVESESDFRITTDTPYLALAGKLWDVYCKDLEENWPRFNGTPSYMGRKHLSTILGSLFIYGVIWF